MILKVMGTDCQNVFSFGGHGVGSVGSHETQVFLCSCDNSQGALRFAPVCPSICPSVCHTLRYRACVINYPTVFSGFF